MASVPRFTIRRCVYGSFVSRSHLTHDDASGMARSVPTSVFNSDSTSPSSAAARTSHPTAASTKKVCEQWSGVVWFLMAALTSRMHPAGIALVSCDMADALHSYSTAFTVAESHPFPFTVKGTSTLSPSLIIDSVLAAKHICASCLSKKSTPKMFGT